ncbi:Abi family protein [Conchiformibius steedae]|uniref:Abi family protein n=1 Tax=Conchiformibius steedae TaxID=153493 RepID=A0A3P2A1U5_9NEIS|nr:Abi family protein [Conchiformibius steedae]RRD89377.1 hypothetical protein EII21_08950 [Conchiformibius steedae]
MPTLSTTNLITELNESLSSERLGTYITYTHGNWDKATELYLWNMYVAGLFIPLLNLMEVILRNRIALALSAIHGPEWAWQSGFQRMLPKKSHSSFCPHSEIQNLSKKYQKSKAIGKLIADCKFAFWQHLLSRNYQHSIWNKHLYRSFPYLTANQNRDTLYQQIGAIREFRNRIAHHEPIFQRDLPADYQNIRAFLTSCQSPDFMAWLDSHQTIVLIQSKIIK